VVSDHRSSEPGSQCKKPRLRRPAAISQIPFLGIADPALEATPTDVPAGQSNAFVHSATSTFWIEWVKSDNHHHGLHLTLHDPA
jgi:hypothetical protein